MRGLYLVTPNWDDTEKMLAVTAAALEGGAALVQYRHKDAGPDLRREQAGALLALCRGHGVPLVINDHLDLCQALDADGVHLGHSDDGIAAARELLGQGKIIGASCYGELKLARAARDAGASYVAFGGFYPSPTKKYTFVTPPEMLDQARAEFSLPIVVIGGMTTQNAVPLVGRGADMVAAINSIYGAVDPAAAARSFGALFPPR